MATLEIGIRVSDIGLARLRALGRRATYPRRLALGDRVRPQNLAVDGPAEGCMAGIGLRGHTSGETLGCTEPALCLEVHA
jgi:hypothetical protein